MSNSAGTLIRSVTNSLLTVKENTCTVLKPEIAQELKDH